MRLASSLQPLWLARGRVREGLAWFDAALTDETTRRHEVAPAVRAGALADTAVLDAIVGDIERLGQAHQALAIARDIGDPALLARALSACGSSASFNPEVAGPYFAEAIGLARTLGDRWRVSQILVWQAYGALGAGDPIAVRAAAEEALDLAETLGDGFVSRASRCHLGTAQMMRGDLADAIAQLRELAADANAAHDVIQEQVCLYRLGHALAYHGETEAARAAANAAIEAAAELGGFFPALAYGALAVAALAEGDVAAAQDASEAAQRLSVQPELASVNVNPTAEVALARGDLGRPDAPPTMPSRQ